MTAMGAQLRLANLPCPRHGGLPEDAAIGRAGSKGNANQTFRLSVRPRRPATESGWVRHSSRDGDEQACGHKDGYESKEATFAADGLSRDQDTPTRAEVEDVTVDFPASSPFVLGCGGTRLDASKTAITDETVWNSNGGGTGGGISALFPVPAYQASVHLPARASGGDGKGRGVPDVAGDADPNTGYRVVVDGQSQVIGGTSAVAPLWAGLFALINAKVGKPSGQPHVTLYAHPSALRDITSGDKKDGGVGYTATSGWDACTGLGSPKGAMVASLFGA